MTTRRGFLASLLPLPVVAPLLPSWAPKPAAAAGLPEAMTLPSRVTCMGTFWDTLWIGTERSGLWRLGPKDDRAHHVPGFTGHVQHIGKIGDQLYVFSDMNCWYVTDADKERWRDAYREIAKGAISG